MKRVFLTTRFLVMFLTLAAIFLGSGCAFIHRHLGEYCNSHAYVQSILADHLTTRFGSQSHVRMAIIPFSAPANVAPRGSQMPGVGDLLAGRVQANLLQSGVVPIVEVLNRKDWPGKKDEFFTGNFGAIAQAREAGYDLVMVGLVEQRQGLETLSAYTKVIDVDSGITLWYGQTAADTVRDDMQKVASTLWLQKRVPNYSYEQPLIDELGVCITEDVLAQRVVPE